MNAPPLPGDFGYVPRLGVADSPAITQDSSRRRIDSREKSGMFGGGGHIGFGGIQLGASASAGSTNQASGNTSSHSNVLPIPPLPTQEVSMATPRTTPRAEE